MRKLNYILRVMGVPRNFTIFGQVLKVDPFATLTFTFYLRNCQTYDFFQKSDYYENEKYTCLGLT